VNTLRKSFCSAPSSALLRFFSSSLDAAPHRIPVALRLAAQRLVDGLHVVEQVRAGVEEAGLVLQVVIW
jgi:hypothetical protein